MSEFLADESRMITVVPNGSWVPGVPTYIETKSQKIKTFFLKILLDKITWSMSGCQFPPAFPPFVSGSGTIVASSKKVKSQGMFCMRVLDNGKCGGLFQPPPVPPSIIPPPPIACSCMFTITNAGINKVKGE